MDRIDHLAPAATTPRSGQPHAVSVPVRTDGIGLALRCAYLPRANDLPNDLSRLIEALDR